MLRISHRFYARSTRLLVKRHFSANARLLAHNGATIFTLNQHLVEAAEFHGITSSSPEKAVLFQSPHLADSESNATLPNSLVALRNWFSLHSESAMVEAFSSYFKEHLDLFVPYELVLGSGKEALLRAKHLVEFLDALRESSEHGHFYPLLAKLVNLEQLRNGVVAAEFIRFDAPLALMDAALRYNMPPRPPGQRVSQLYIAQLPLSDLPQPLQHDIPTPACLTAPASPDASYAADVYNSSLWLGLEPTFTPWHRDPNANLFRQLCGVKTVRMMPPQPGRRVFEQVMRGLGQSAANTAIRGEEMMQGAERQAWLDAVWGPSAPEGMLEVMVRPRDMLFLPKGWWHSVRSAQGDTGDLNVSVNWWFRWRNSHPRRFQTKVESAPRPDPDNKKGQC
jgi:hypothetical protein